ncbi:MAG: alpha/beta fold hydrolase [Thermoanaerobaculia bacterium]
MPTRESFLLEPASGRSLDGIVDLPDRAGPAPVVVICHGFKGFMEWGFFPPLAELLAARGFTVVRFNLSGSGMRPGEDRVRDEAAFRHATIGRDVEDQTAVLRAVLEGRLAAGRVDTGRVGLLGHSRGGGTTLLLAASELGREHTRALVTWSAVGTFDRFGAEEKRAWRGAGEAPVVNSRTGQTLLVSSEVLDDIETRADAYDLAAAAGRRQAPWLIVHGSADETVPVAEGRALAAAAAEPVDLHVVEGASHTFGAQHPFAGPTPQLIEAMNATQGWFLRHLGAAAS